MLRRGPERGAVTVFAIACMGLLLLMGAALGVVGAFVSAHRTAQSAADLGALGGASAEERGEAACAAAQQIVVANAAVLTDCHLEGDDVVVEVSVSGPRWLGAAADLAAQARAGPAG